LNDDTIVWGCLTWANTLQMSSHVLALNATADRIDLTRNTNSWIVAIRVERRTALGGRR
jgi:hypothetical protein